MRLKEHNSAKIYEIEFRKDGGLTVRVYEGNSLQEVFSVHPDHTFSFLDSLLQKAVVVRDD